MVASPRDRRRCPSKSAFRRSAWQRHMISFSASSGPEPGSAAQTAPKLPMPRGRRTRQRTSPTCTEAPSCSLSCTSEAGDMKESSGQPSPREGSTQGVLELEVPGPVLQSLFTRSASRLGVAERLGLAERARAKGAARSLGAGPGL